MEAITETTGGLFPAHTYLLDGTNLVAYIRTGGYAPFYFKQPIKGFSKSGRKFVRADTKLFKIKVDTPSNLRTIAGSKGATYTLDLDLGTCTCSGYTFRGTCKHVKELETA